MKTMILHSNWRLQVAIMLVRIRGRDGGTMAEVRDAIAERQRIRQQYHFARWFMSHYQELCYRFDMAVARGLLNVERYKSRADAIEHYAANEFAKN